MKADRKKEKNVPCQFAEKSNNRQFLQLNKINGDSSIFILFFLSLSFNDQIHQLNQSKNNPKRASLFWLLKFD